MKKEIHYRLIFLLLLLLLLLFLLVLLLLHGLLNFELGGIDCHVIITAYRSHIH